MNHPSVLFHGLANESTGGIEREQALTTLHSLDRALDGTRLTGQAAYGSEPDDRTSRPLDVAGLISRLLLTVAKQGSKGAHDQQKTVPDSHASILPSP